jgi:trafficking protein particle complex subunit 11
VISPYSFTSVTRGAAMEDYPEELRTPPVSLVYIVGCPELHPSISTTLSSQQPPMNTLALP